MKNRNKIKLKILSFLSLLSICLMTLFSGNTYAFQYNNFDYGLYYYVDNIEIDWKYYKVVNNVNVPVQVAETFTYLQLKDLGIIDSTYSRLSTTKLFEQSSLRIGVDPTRWELAGTMQPYDFYFNITFGFHGGITLEQYNFYYIDNSINLSFRIDGYTTYVINDYSYNYFDFGYYLDLSGMSLDDFASNEFNYIDFGYNTQSQSYMTYSTFEYIDNLYSFSSYKQAINYFNNGGDSIISNNADLQAQINYLNTIISQKDAQISSLQNQIATSSNVQLNFRNLIWTIGSTPFESFKQIWNVDFLGINIAQFFTGLFGALVVVWVIKKFIG